MPSNTSIFADEWRDCLRAHFTYVMRMNDKITEKTLRGVMLEAGFTDAELKELTVRATMHMDNVDPDFVPDMSILEAEPIVVPGIAIAVPQEIIEAAVVEESLALDEANTMAELDTTEAEIDTIEADVEESQTAEVEIDNETQSEADEPPVDPDITQLSLF